MSKQLKQQAAQNAKEAALRFIGARENEGKVALSRWTIWRMENEGTFPKSIKVGNKRLWIESEVDAWMAERIAERG